MSTMRGAESFSDAAADGDGRGGDVARSGVVASACPSNKRGPWQWSADRTVRTVRELPVTEVADDDRSSGVDSAATVVEMSSSSSAASASRPRALATNGNVCGGSDAILTVDLALPHLDLEPSAKRERRYWLSCPNNE